MKELESAIVAAFSKMAESGALNKVIEEKVAHAVSACVAEALGSYSEFGKGLSEHIKTALKVDFGRLGLVGYNDMVLKIIKQKLDHSINTVGIQRIEKELSELLVDPPAELKLSELVEMYKKSRDSSDGNSRRLTVIVDKTDSTGLCPGYAHIYMDKESGKTKYMCEIQMDTTPTGEVYGLKLSGADIKNTLFTGPHFGFERQLFQLYAAGTKIIIDDDDVDDYYGDND